MRGDVEDILGLGLTVSRDPEKENSEPKRHVAPCKPFEYRLQQQSLALSMEIEPQELLDKRPQVRAQVPQRRNVKVPRALDSPKHIKP